MRAYVLTAFLAIAAAGCSGAPSTSTHIVRAPDQVRASLHLLEIDAPAGPDSILPALAGAGDTSQISAIYGILPHDDMKLILERLSAFGPQRFVSSYVFIVPPGTERRLAGTAFGTASGAALKAAVADGQTTLSYALFRGTDDSRDDYTGSVAMDHGTSVVGINWRQGVATLTIVQLH